MKSSQFSGVVALLTHQTQIDFPILINRMNQFLILGLLGGIFHFYWTFNIIYNSVSKLTTHSAASDLDLPCFDSLRPSQQFFSCVGTSHPGLNQY